MSTMSVLPSGVLFFDMTEPVIGLGFDQLIDNGRIPPDYDELKASRLPEALMMRRNT